MEGAEGLEAVKSRAKIARKNAGLSIGQAARLLGMLDEDVRLTEEADVACERYAPRLADVYGVNIPWLLGEVEHCDYDALKGIQGADGLTFHDRDVIAEFIASMPRKTKE